MNYEGDIIRPPSEANSIILQATVGCSHNKCTFCGAYRDRNFRLKEENTIEADLAFAAEYCRRLKTLFLADGNALAMPQAKLVSLLQRIRGTLPWGDGSACTPMPGTSCAAVSRNCDSCANSA